MVRLSDVLGTVGSSSFRMIPINSAGMLSMLGTVILIVAERGIGQSRSTKTRRKNVLFVLDTLVYHQGTKDGEKVIRSNWNSDRIRQKS